MANVNVTIRIDENVRNEADKLFNELGLNLTTAINAFIKQSIREQRLPFELTINPKISHPSRQQLDKILNEEFKEHQEAYRELAK